MRFRVELIDTWNMTVDEVAGEFTVVVDGVYRYHAEGWRDVQLPGRSWMALRITRVGGDVLKPVATQHVFGEVN
jgi:hypothetical protein